MIKASKFPPVASLNLQLLDARPKFVDARLLRGAAQAIAQLERPRELRVLGLQMVCAVFLTMISATRPVDYQTGEAFTSNSFEPRRTCGDYVLDHQRRIASHDVTGEQILDFVGLGSLAL